jgi:hypothetical protein
MENDARNESVEEINARTESVEEDVEQKTKQRWI